MINHLGRPMAVVADVAVAPIVVVSTYLGYLPLALNIVLTIAATIWYVIQIYSWYKTGRVAPK